MDRNSSSSGSRGDIDIVGISVDVEPLTSVSRVNISRLSRGLGNCRLLAVEVMRASSRVVVVDVGNSRDVACT